jgi:hypothetical protein
VLIALVAIAAASGRAYAIDHACEFVEWGFGYMKVEDRGEAWTYSLETPGPMWRAEGFGYHAPGWLSCVGCSTRGKGAGGVYYFITPSDDQNPAPPANAAARATRSTESFGYPPMRFTSHHLDVEGTREGVSVGPLSGYAVLYKVSLKDRGQDWAEGGLNDQRGLLVVHLTDGCMSFNTTIATDRTGNKDVWEPLDTLLAEIMVRKTPTADFKPQAPPKGSEGVIVRRRPQEQPIGPTDRQ